MQTRTIQVLYYYDNYDNTKDIIATFDNLSQSDLIGAIKKSLEEVKSRFPLSYLTDTEFTEMAKSIAEYNTECKRGVYFWLDDNELYCY